MNRLSMAFDLVVHALVALLAMYEIGVVCLPGTRHGQLFRP